MLTRKQYELLTWLDAYMKRTGICPSYEEMKDAVSLKSKSGVHSLILSLKKRGYIRHVEGRARAIEVIKSTADGVVSPSRRTQFHGPCPESGNLIRGTFGYRQSTDTYSSEFRETDSESKSDGSLVVPVLGKIAAGAPIEALSDIISELRLSTGLLGHGSHYALVVSGDSMVEAGIHDGDIAVVRQTNQAETGSIVVALVDGLEVTLKRLRSKGNTIALEPANVRMKPIIYGPDRVQIQGCLVILIRRYTN